MSRDGVGKWRVVQCYTGGIGSEIIRRLAGHPQLELVGVLVHDLAKAGKDSGTLAGVAPNGVLTTASLDDIIALKPDGAIWSGKTYDVDAYARLLEAGINLYTGMGGYFIEDEPEEPKLSAAATKGNASFCAGGNIPGLISDVLPLFLSGYTGRIRQLRAWQRNHVAGNHSAFQLSELLGIGRAPGASTLIQRVNQGWTSVATQGSRMIAKGMGLRWESVKLLDVEYALAPHSTVLAASGVTIEKGTVAGLRWTLAGYAAGREFYRLVNEQTAMLGLGDDWRQTLEAPAWHVEIDGDPPIVANFGWGAGAEPGLANTHLNAARALNMLPRVITARAGLLTVLDFPAAVAADGLRIA
jgi:4-hydroxy-tetrahydrodipicolinate reductase